MDFFKGIGDWFRGAFGGNDDDEEKKRKQQQNRNVTRVSFDDWRKQNQPPKAQSQGNRPKLQLQLQGTETKKPILQLFDQPKEDKPKIQIGQPQQQPRIKVQQRQDRTSELTKKINENPYYLRSRKDEVEKNYTEQERRRATEQSRRQRLQQIKDRNIWGNLDQELASAGRDGRYRQSVGKRLGNAIFKLKGDNELSSMNFGQFINNYNRLSGDEQADVREELQKAALYYRERDKNDAVAQYASLLATILDKDYGLVDQKDTSFWRNVGRDISTGGFVGSAGEGIMRALGGGDSYSSQRRNIERSNTGVPGVIGDLAGGIIAAPVDVTAGNIQRSFTADKSDDAKKAQEYVEAYKNEQMSLQDLHQAIRSLKTNSNVNSSGFVYDEETGQLRDRTPAESMANFFGRTVEAGTTLAPFGFGRAAGVGNAARAGSRLQNLTPTQAVLAADSLSAAGQIGGAAMQGQEIGAADIATAVVGTALGNIGGLAGRARNANRIANLNSPEGMAQARQESIRLMKEQRPDMPDAEIQRLVDAELQARTNNPQTPETSPSQPAQRPATPEQQKVIDDAIRQEEARFTRFLEENPSLTPDEIAVARQAHEERKAQLVNELSESQRATQEATETQGAELEQSIQEQQAINQQVQEQQQASTAPVQGDRVATPEGTPELDANDVYIKRSDLSSEDGRRSPQVTPEQFMEHRTRGEQKLKALDEGSETPYALEDPKSWNNVIDESFNATREPWGGATIDSHTGKHVPVDADAYALTVKDPGMESVSVSPTASRAQFAQAMEEAKQRFAHILARKNSHLGVFHDADTGMIDIDPVLITQSLDDVHDIGAYTRSTGGAYHFKSGDGFWAPHVADDAVASSARPEVETNNAYSAEAYDAAQLAKEGELRQNPFRRLFNGLRQAIVDPRTVQQSYDNAEFRRLRKKGLIKPGQKEVDPEQSLAVLQGRIENPAEPVQVRIGEPINVNGKNISIRQIIRKYGADDTPAAREFANYRLFKDELERMGKGGQNTLGVSPNDMTRFVREYEARNPGAIDDNAALRAFALDNYRRRVEAGIDNREMFEASAELEFYAPRTTVSPEDAVRPTIAGFISRSPSGTQVRGESAPVSHSPLSLYYMDAIRTERSIATQQRNNLLRERAERGEEGFGIEIDANKVVAHRDALRQVRDLADRVRSMKNVRGKAKKDVKDAKQGEAVRAEAANFVRDFLRQAMPDSRFGDIAPITRMDEATYNTQKTLLEVDYARSMDAVMKDPMTDQARRVAVKEVEDNYQTQLAQLEQQRAGTRDVSAVEAMTDEEALELLEVMSEVGESGTKRVAARLAKQSNLSVEDAEDFLRGVQNEIGELRRQGSSTWQEAMDNAQYMERDVEAVTYMVDGERGRIRIPADLADELRRNNELVNRNGLERVWGGLANAMKVTWTGALSPVFKTFQIAKNLPLAYRNADGLSGIDHRALQGFVGQVFQTPRIRQFKREMMLRGASYENALQTKNISRDSTADIAARANLITFFKRNPARSLGDIWKGLSHGLSYIDNAQRTAVANGAYHRARRLGYDEETALQMASQAPGKVFGDFNRVSRLAQNMETILPYSGAIQAGARAMAQATRQKPIQTTIKDATIIAGVGGFAAYSMFNNSEYYKDMIESGKEYELDNFITLVLPGASQNEDGTWEGIIKLPLTPDLRPFNRATWQTIYALTQEDADRGVDPGMIAYEIFNEFTGDISNSIYDRDRTNDGRNPINGLFAGSPVGNMIKIASGVDPYTGEPLADENLSRLDRTQQYHEGYTSDNARRLSEATGGVVTPLQVDRMADQFGATGDFFQNRPDADGERRNPLANFFDFGRQLRPGKGTTEEQARGRQYYENLDIVSSMIDKDDEVTFRKFQALHSKKTEDQKKNLLTSAQKAHDFMSYTGDGSFTTTPLFVAEKELDRLNREQGQPGNPLFDLAPQQLQKVLTYRSMKIPNAAKQNYTRDGEGAFTALGLDEKWYSDFQKAESAYYDEIFKDQPENEFRTFSGESKPRLTPEQEALEQQYYSLPKGTGQRKAFLQANQWLLDHWADSNAFTDEERKALGFSILQDDEEGSGGGGYGYGYGRGGGPQPYGNLLGELTNFTRGVNALSPIEAQAMPELQRMLRALQAGRGGGRSRPPFGASSRGQG